MASFVSFEIGGAVRRVAETAFELGSCPGPNRVSTERRESLLIGNYDVANSLFTVYLIKSPLLTWDQPDSTICDSAYLAFFPDFGALDEYGS